MPLFLFYILLSLSTTEVLTQKGLELRQNHKINSFELIIKKSLVFHWVLGINYAKQQLQHN